MKKRLEWRIERYSSDAALACIGPSEQFAEEAYVRIRFTPRDLRSMQEATEQAADFTREYRAKGWTVSDRQLTLKAMMGGE